MAAIFLGFGLLLVASLVGWVLEKLGIIEVPASSLREVAGSSHRNSVGARDAR